MSLTSFTSSSGSYETNSTVSVNCGSISLHTYTISFSSTSGGNDSYILNIAECGGLGNETASVTSGASPMTADKRASIYDFIHAFEEKKKAKKKPKPEVDSKLAKLSPLVEFIEEAYA